MQQIVQSNRNAKLNQILKCSGAADGGQEGGGDVQNIDVVPQRLRERRCCRHHRRRRVSKCDRFDCNVLGGGPTGMDRKMHHIVQANLE